MKRLLNAIKSMDECLKHLDKIGDARKLDGIDVRIYASGEVELVSGFLTICFDDLEEFIDYMEKKKWKKRK